MKRQVKQFCKHGHDLSVCGRDSNYDCRACKRAWHRKWSHDNLIKRTCSKYKISEIDLLNLIDNQKELCAICGQKTKLVVDHNHKTGKVRGLLCTRCNLVLGQCEDNTEIFSKFIEYLKNLV